MKWRAALLIAGLLLGSAPVRAVKVTRPLLGQRVTNAAFLNTTFCRTYGCKIGSMTIEGTGSGNAVELNNRRTDVLLSHGLVVRLLREPNTTLVSADLNSVVSGSQPPQWTEMADTAADFFAMMLHRPVNSQTPEIQNCIKLFKGPYKLDDFQNFWKVGGNTTGLCLINKSGTAAGPKVYFVFIAELP